MTRIPIVRRFLVTVGIAGALVAAGVTVHAASIWAATSAPLSVAPVAVESIQSALDQERARSAALAEQLVALESSASQLREALAAAQAQAGTDQSTADQLRSSLTAAQAKLTRLEASLRAAGSSSASPGAGGGTTTPSGDDGERDDD